MSSVFNRFLELITTVRILNAIMTANSGISITIDENAVKEFQKMIKELIEKYDELLTKLKEYEDVLEKVRHAEYIEIIGHRYKYVRVGAITTWVLPLVRSVSTVIKPIDIDLQNVTNKITTVVAQPHVEVSAIKG